MKLSVIICAYNPKPETFNQVLDALKKQTLDKLLWELIVIDNNSDSPLKDWVDLTWTHLGVIVEEHKPGLAHARITGLNRSKSKCLLFVDDDNILATNYLEESLIFFEKHPEVGCFGGKSIPVFETKPPEWFFECGINLGCQDFGDQLYISELKNKPIFRYPEKAPIGTGLVIRKECFKIYQNYVQKDKKRMSLGRKGNELTSGEDNDIILTVVKAGYEIAYLPSLIVNHIIPSFRFSVVYLNKMAFESNRSWVKVLNIHGLCPWKPIKKWSYPLRKLKSYLTNKPWKSEINTIKYLSSLGTLKGLSEIA